MLIPGLCDIRRPQAGFTDFDKANRIPEIFFLVVRSESISALPLFPLPLLYCRCHCKLNRHTLVPLQAVLLYQLPTVFVLKVGLLVARLDASKSPPSSPYSPRLPCFRGLEHRIPHKATVALTRTRPSNQTYREESLKKWTTVWVVSLLTCGLNTVYLEKNSILMISQPSSLTRGSTFVI